MGRDSAVDDAEHHRLMVSLERDDALRHSGLQIEQVADNSCTLRPPVDVVAEKDEGHWPTFGIPFAALHQALQLAE